MYFDANTQYLGSEDVIKHVEKQRSILIYLFLYHL